MNTGIKIGEVDENSALIWTRLTKEMERNEDRDDMASVMIEYDKKDKNVLKKVKFEDGATLDTLPGASPGAKGEVRVGYRAKDDSDYKYTDWEKVEDDSDYTFQFKLSNLRPGTKYELEVEARPKDSKKNKVSDKLKGEFRTAPKSNESEKIVFTVTTCHNGRKGEDGNSLQIYDSMKELQPDFMVHTGDAVYYDKKAKTIGLARWYWQTTYSRKSAVKFHKDHATYFIKDDHDTWQQDCWPGMKSDYMGDFTFEQGLKLHREQVPISKVPYRTFRWGKDLQIWLAEGREFRDPNTKEDGPSKTLWGNKQLDWFQNTVEQSDATFKILISPLPIVGPDNEQKLDNHAQGFRHEGERIMKFLKKHDMFVICGDRHWQYASTHPQTQVKEFSVGPGSDYKAGHWDQDDFIDNYHRFLRVKGGFVSVSVEGGKLFLRHHSVAGSVVFEDKMVAK